MRAHDEHRDGPPVSGPPPPDPDRELVPAIVWLQTIVHALLGALPVGYSARNIRSARRGGAVGWALLILLVLAFLIIAAVEVSRFFPFGFSLP